MVTSAIKHESSRPARRKTGQYCTLTEEKIFDVERFEEELCYPLTLYSIVNVVLCKDEREFLEVEPHLVVQQIPNEVLVELEVEDSA